MFSLSVWSGIFIKQLGIQWDLLRVYGKTNVPLRKRLTLFDRNSVSLRMLPHTLNIFSQTVFTAKFAFLNAPTSTSLLYWRSFKNVVLCSRFPERPVFSSSWCVAKQIQSFFTGQKKPKQKHVISQWSLRICNTSILYPLIHQSSMPLSSVSYLIGSRRQFQLSMNEDDNGSAVDHRSKSHERSSSHTRM